MSVRPLRNMSAGAECAALVIGAGACGYTTALTLKDAGYDPVIVERDALPQGSTALSSGMIPACDTAFQRVAGIEDSVALMVADIRRKNKGEADAAVVEVACAASGPAVDWLAERHGIAFALVEGFLYPGHSRLRMHAPPSKTGAALICDLARAGAAAGLDLITEARATILFADEDSRVGGARIERPDGTTEDIACRALVLACNGYGGAPDLVRRHIPEMAEALYCGHAGNQGDALAWGLALGAEARHLGAYQGHGSVAVGHNVLITWALMMRGGIQVNAHARRFSNEHQGYSEQAVHVLREPDGVAWNVYDSALHELGMTFEDYRQARAAGAIRRGADAGALADAAGLPAEALETTIMECRARARVGGTDPFGRDWSEARPLEPPYYAVKVTGALFHTQGGLAIDPGARVLCPDGNVLPNLFAAGGAACGLSGRTVSGYLSGNGLLSAVALGRVAGRSAAAVLGGGRR